MDVTKRRFFRYLLAIRYRTKSESDQAASPRHQASNSPEFVRLDFF